MNNQFTWRDFLSFDKMIAPTFLSAVYLVHLVVHILGCLWFINQGIGLRYGSSTMFTGGVIGLVAGPFLIRLFYEFIIVIFKIHSRLANIDVQTRKEGTANAPELDIDAALR